VAPRKQKIEHRFIIMREQAPGAAYLLMHNFDIPEERDEHGHLVMNIDKLDRSFNVSAWTSLANAKRQAAQQVGRSSLRWLMEEDPEYRQPTTWKASYTEKVTP
jgi:hypothetical protein